MSEIIRTEAIVLSKLDYGDTSSIVSLYTRLLGKFSVIIKGARKSKLGKVADPPNYLNTIIYKKDSRELQILTEADLISHYPRLKDNFEKLQYAYAVTELLKKLIAENESNERLFKGVVRILDLFNTSNEHPVITFGRFFFFFLTEIGYEIQLSKCISCGKTTLSGSELSYNFEFGILCQECKSKYLESFYINTELFNYLICLKSNIPVDGNNPDIQKKAINFMERYLKFHVPDFHEIQSLFLIK